MPEWLAFIFNDIGRWLLARHIRRGPIPIPVDDGPVWREVVLVSEPLGEPLITGGWGE